MANTINTFKIDAGSSWDSINVSLDFFEPQKLDLETFICSYKRSRLAKEISEQIGGNIV